MIGHNPEAMIKAFWKAQQQRQLSFLEQCELGNAIQGYRQLQEESMSKGKTRTFESGATRDSDDDKPDYEGYLSPLVVDRYGQYMLKHQTDSANEQRGSDNWQRGIPREQYMKSAWRHFMDVWRLHRNWPLSFRSDAEHDIEEALCALKFNVDGMLHEILAELQHNTKDLPPDIIKGEALSGRGGKVWAAHDDGVVDISDWPEYFEVRGMRYVRADKECDGHKD